MTEVSVELLFDEFALRHARGERPDVREYLERAGAEREELGRLIDRYLEVAPAREPTEEEIVLMQARLEHEPPILLLRQRRKLGRRAVVDTLIDALGLDPTKREKVAGYYHELEVGLLDPTGVDGSVWRTLGDVLTANVEALAGVREGLLPAPQAVYLRSEEAGPAPAGPEQPSPAERDEIDRLFTRAT